MQRPGLILVASYPKSGNTWFRVVLRSALLRGAEIDINRIGFYNAADRLLCDRILGIPTAELSSRDVANLRPNIYESALKYFKTDLTLKVHDAWLPPFEGGAVPFSSRSIKHVVYIVRDPRATAASVARFMGLTVDQAIERMNNPLQLMGSNHLSLDSQVPQFVSSWSRHVTSWIDAEGLSMTVLRYEDMIDNPLAAFGPVIRRLLPHISDTEIEKSIHAAQFSRLSSQEAERGFTEKYSWSKSFFSSGRKDSWREELTPLQAETLASHHEAVMRRLGYVDAERRFSPEESAPYTDVSETG